MINNSFNFDSNRSNRPCVKFDDNLQIFEYQVDRAPKDIDNTDEAMSENIDRLVKNNLSNEKTEYAGYNQDIHISDLTYTSDSNLHSILQATANLNIQEKQRFIEVQTENLTIVAGSQNRKSRSRNQDNTEIQLDITNIQKNTINSQENEKIKRRVKPKYFAKTSNDSMFNYRDDKNDKNFFSTLDHLFNNKPEEKEHSISNKINSPSSTKRRLDGEDDRVRKLRKKTIDFSHLHYQEKILTHLDNKYFEMHPLPKSKFASGQLVIGQDYYKKWFDSENTSETLVERIKTYYSLPKAPVQSSADTKWGKTTRQPKSRLNEDPVPVIQKKPSVPVIPKDSMKYHILAYDKMMTENHVIKIHTCSTGYVQTYAIPEVDANDIDKAKENLFPIGIYDDGKHIVPFYSTKSHIAPYTAMILLDAGKEVKLNDILVDRDGGETSEKTLQRYIDRQAEQSNATIGRKKIENVSDLSEWQKAIEECSSLIVPCFSNTDLIILDAINEKTATIRNAHLGMRIDIPTYIFLENQVRSKDRGTIYYDSCYYVEPN